MPLHELIGRLRLRVRGAPSNGASSSATASRNGDLGTPYEAGLAFGRLGVDPEVCAEYFHRKGKAEALEAEAERFAAEARAYEERLARSVERRALVEAYRCEIKHQHGVASQAQKEIEGLRQRMADARKNLTALAGRGSVWLAVLFIVAGFLFVAGDFLLADHTVSESLDIDGVHGLLFALALGLLAFLLKPLYDRWVEDPYHEGKKKAFAWVMGGCALAVVVLLLSVGYYRAEHVAKEQRVGSINAQIEVIDGRSQSAMLLGDDAEVAALRDARQALEQRRTEIEEGFFGHVTLYPMLMLAQLLFAVAGAVCLGIGFRHLFDWWHERRPLALDLGRTTWFAMRHGEPTVAARLREAERRAREAEARRRALEVEVARLEEEQEAEEPDEVLRGLADEARLRAARTRRDRDAQQAEMSKELFIAGVLRGQREAGVSPPSALPPKTKRPYVALRSALRKAYAQRPTLGTP